MQWCRLLNASATFAGLLSSALFFGGCRTVPTGDSQLRATEPDASSAYLLQLASEADYTRLAKHDTETNTVYVKLTVDNKADGSPVYYQDTKKYAFHQTFLSKEIARFRGRTFTMDEILFGDTKEVSGGVLYYAKDVKIGGLQAPGVLGFEIYFNPAEQVDVGEIAKVFARIKATAPFASSQLVYLFSEPGLFFANKTKLDALNIPSGRVAQVVGHGTDGSAGSPGASSARGAAAPN